MNKEKAIIFLPSLCLIAILVFIPFLMLAYKSLSVGDSIGIANYLELFRDSTFKKALKNTFSISFYVVSAT
ncbi:MAG: hypothetical protein PF518_12520 [Spirochaetaceae bacterium]|jgi:putative spermidine/putrescine transport system permease protein|nr:hypothetical protein [Spirochaetaceae bacterium]